MPVLLGVAADVATSSGMGQTRPSGSERLSLGSRPVKRRPAAVVGQFGSGHARGPPAVDGEPPSTYRRSLGAGARPDTALAFPVHVTTSRARAREECAPSLLRFFREAGERLRPFGEADIKTYEAFQQVLARMQRVTFDDIDREMGVFGDPDYCVERVRALRRDYQMDEFICYFNQGGIMDQETVRASMTRFAREVMPHCR
jgi:alkanesulfonate monooxygenase SsuD/methylene tetrahydromethanopterin reductase-like flavin-dependent oxidoreductase (luciferase family)